jgi:hypothetical protein
MPLKIYTNSTVLLCKLQKKVLFYIYSFIDFRLYIWPLMYNLSVRKFLTIAMFIVLACLHIMCKDFYFFFFNLTSVSSGFGFHSHWISSHAVFLLGHLFSLFKKKIGRPLISFMMFICPSFLLVICPNYLTSLDQTWYFRFCYMQYHHNC